jgi:hypothetical protein
MLAFAVRALPGKSKTDLADQEQRHAPVQFSKGMAVQKGSPLCTQFKFLC